MTYILVRIDELSKYFHINRLTLIDLVHPRVGDLPELHDGRVRGASHTAGLWPTHVYLDCTLHSFWL